MNFKAARTSAQHPEASLEGKLAGLISGIPTAVTWLNRLSLATHGEGSGWTEELSDQRYAALKPGPQTYSYRYTVKVYGTPPTKGERGKLMGERVIEGTLPWDLVAENAGFPLPQVRPDPTLQPAVENSFTVRILRDLRDETLIEVDVYSEKPPAGMAFDLSLRAGGETYALGPVAWVRGHEASWRFTTDLEQPIERADLVLKPSAQAAARLQGDPNHRFEAMNVKEIWDGPEIVIANREIARREVSLGVTWKPTDTVALDYAISQMDPADPAVQQMARDRQTSAARAQLEQRSKVQPNDVAVLYELGCVLAAEARLGEAMKRFVVAQALEAPPALRRQIRIQQRRICSQWYSAEYQKPAAMLPLGEAYQFGWGVPIDLEEARRRYRLASNAGNPAAMCRLAAMYETMTGATVHTAPAEQWYQSQTLEWYRQSARLGNAEAKAWMKRHAR